MSLSASRSHAGPPILMQRMHHSHGSGKHTKSVGGTRQPTHEERGKGGGGNGLGSDHDYVSELREALSHVEVDSGSHTEGELGKTVGGKGSREKDSKQRDVRAAQVDVIETLMSGGQKKNMSSSAQIDQVRAVAEKNKRRLRKENEALAKISLVTQENMITNDERFGVELRQLKEQLDESVERKLLSQSDVMAGLRSTNNIIQGEIAQLRGVAERQAQQELDTLKEAFQRQLEDKKRELEELIESGKNSSGEWTKRNNALQDELKVLVQKTEACTSLNTKLEDRNKHLRIEFEAQADDTGILESEFHRAKLKNQQLRELIAELEGELSQAMADVQGTPYDAHHRGDDLPESGLPNEDSSASHDERVRKYEEAIQRTRRMIELENNNLKAVRQAHLNVLSCRTELEVYLRQAILAHQKELRAANEKENVGMSVFAAEDRKRVIERLLSKERVLQLLYADAGAQAREEATSLEAPEHVSIEDLWSKWRQWAEDANADPQQQ
eukprot:PhM_4_TR8241/c0_g1_i1/m.102178